MPFTNGRVSFTRLLVQPGPSTPNLPTHTLTTDAVNQLDEHAFTKTDIGIPLETETGWITTNHIDDTNITHDAIAARSDEAALLALRIDTNTPPADIKRAVRARHEQALARDNPSGKPSRAQRQEAKNLAEHELHEQMAAGIHRRSAATQLLWDIPQRTILAAASSSKALEALAERFRTTFQGASLIPASAGTLGYRHLAATGRDRDFEDLRPTPFTDPPPIARPASDEDAPFSTDNTAAIPDCPWARASPEPRDFLANELLIWLWFICDQHEGLINTPDPDNPNATAQLAITLDRTLDMECAWNTTGKLSLRDHAGGPAPIRHPEAAEALSLGKWPRKTGIVIADNSTGEDAGQVWSCTLQADRWAISAATLPNPPEDLEDATQERDFRLDRTLRLDRLLLAVYHHFLDLRTSADWPETHAEIRRWITAHRKRRIRGLATAATNTPAPNPLHTIEARPNPVPTPPPQHAAASSQ